MDKTPKTKKSKVPYHPIGLIEFFVRFRCLRLTKRHGNQYKNKH